MSVERLEFLVEEPSMEAVLRALMPSWLDGIDFEVFTYQGKQDLMAKLPDRLRGYSHFLPASWRVIVLVDRDDSACRALKEQLERAAINAGLVTRSTSKSGIYQVANRIVIEEVESWYFGDWQAVRGAYPKISENQTDKAGFRDADAISGGTWEAFERVAREAGYFKNGLRKVEIANRIGSLLDPTRNTSRSFRAFRNVIDELIAEP